MSMVSLSPLQDSSSEDSGDEPSAAETTSGPQVVLPKPAESLPQISHEEIDGVVVVTDRECLERTSARKAEALALDGSTPQNRGQPVRAQSSSYSWGSEPHRQDPAGSRQEPAEATGEQPPDLGFLPKGAAPHRGLARLRKLSRSGPPSLRRAGMTSLGATRDGGAAAVLWSAACTWGPVLWGCVRAAGGLV
jgi:hypothetical protein